MKIKNNHIWFGTFKTGLPNYGFTGEPQTTIIYLPSFEDLCLTTPETYQDENVFYADIRYFYEVYIQGTGTELELLYTDDYEINPEYAEIFQEAIRKKRDAIAHMNPYLRINSAITRANAAYKEGKYFEFMRLTIAMEKYIKGYPIDTCYHSYSPIEYHFLEELLKGRILTQTEYDTYSKSFKDYLWQVQEMQYDESISNEFKKGLLQIMQKAVQSEIYSPTSANLTPIEDQAIDIIIRQLLPDDEGYVSINKIVASSTISRPVFDNALKKLVLANFIETKSGGAKGLYIKILNKNKLLEETGEHYA